MNTLYTYIFKAKDPSDDTEEVRRSRVDTLNAGVRENRARLEDGKKLRTGDR
jgi:hypothetical protein